MASVDDVLKDFKTIFKDVSHPWFCTGSVFLYDNTATVFYRSEGKARAIDFTDPSDHDPKKLSKACKKATFGVAKKDVLDESYRKAGKIDAKDISTQFSPLESGILNTVREVLIPNATEGSIYAELYKLNVYGPGSFFKAHVDTPHGDNFFASLVVVLPTKHEGGSLIFRHEGRENIVNTAEAVSNQAGPHAAFVAFFSGVEHEVSEVTEGYRVTLTYNLFMVDKPTPTPITASEDPLDELKVSLQKLLADPKFLPDGGFLGFGLSHVYPFNPSTTILSSMMTRLKGSDATVRRICNALKIDVSLRAVYERPENLRDRHRYDFCLLEKFADLERYGIVEDNCLIDSIWSDYDGVWVYPYRGSVDDGKVYCDSEDPAQPIIWIKALKERNLFSSPYIAFGNDATMDHLYGEICLVAEIDPARERDEVEAIEEDSGDSGDSKDPGDSGDSEDSDELYSLW